MSMVGKIREYLRSGNREIGLVFGCLSRVQLRLREAPVKRAFCPYVPFVLTITGKPEATIKQSNNTNNQTIQTIKQYKNPNTQTLLQMVCC